MKSLSSLKNVLVKLTDEELHLLKKNLNQNLRKEQSVKLKSQQLIKLLSGDKQYTLGEMQFNIYGKLNYHAFNKLTTRLNQKVLEIITLDKAILSNNFSKRNTINLDLRKKLLLADILQLKGLRKEVLPHYNKIISNAKKFELYDIQIRALNSKQRLQSVNSKFKLFKRINKEISEAEISHLSLNDANKIYNEITNIINNSDNYFAYKNELIQCVEKLEKLLSASNSPTIGYYYFTLCAELWEKQSEFIKSKQSLEKVQEILLKNESAYTSNRYGTVLLNLANNSIFLKQYDDAIRLANATKEYFKGLPLTLLIVDEILFFAHFYKKDFFMCNHILINKTRNIDSDILKSKFSYFQSCIYFENKDYTSSLQELSRYKEIKKDREGWNINIRILFILNRIELKQYESVDLQIQNLEKYIKRVSKSKDISPRYLIILRILIKLIQENFNYNLVYKKRMKYFNYLESDNNQYAWEIKSPELIVFQTWFKNKVLKTITTNY
jgi:hypothetical protein